MCKEFLPRPELAKHFRICLMASLELDTFAKQNFVYGAIDHQHQECYLEIKVTPLQRLLNNNTLLNSNMVMIFHRMKFIQQPMTIIFLCGIENIIIMGLRPVPFEILAV